MPRSMTDLGKILVVFGLTLAIIGSFLILFPKTLFQIIMPEFNLQGNVQTTLFLKMIFMDVGKEL